jgi:DNA anti-recombination protein RmuC
MTKKNITIDELAVMMKNIFDGQNEFLNKRFDKIDEHFGKIEKDIKDIKGDLKETIKRTDKLEMRVDYVENVLDIPAQKH